MKLEELEKKLAELLNISEAEGQSAFSIFKNELAKYLNFGEAIKIDQLGVFQKKEQFFNTNQLDPLKKAGLTPTLLFTAENKLTSDDELFFKLDLPNQIENIFEFNEKVFNLGIGVKFVTIKAESEILIDNEESLESKIEHLISNATKIPDYDLWEDYLQSKENKNILNDNDNLELEKFIDEEIFDEEQEALSSDDFIEIDENNITDSTTIEEKIEENSNDASVVLPDENIELIPLVDPWKETPDIIEDEFTDFSKKENLKDSSDKDIYTEIKNLKFNDDSDFINEKNIEIKTDTEPIIIEEDKNKLDKTELSLLENELPSVKADAKKELLSNKDLSSSLKRKRSRLNFVSIFLIASFILLGFIIIYIYTLLNKTQSSDSQVKPKTESVQQNVMEQSLLTEDTKTGDQKELVENQNQIEKTSKEGTDLSNVNVDNANEKMITDNIVTETKKVSVKSKNSVEESEVAKNIFFDGKQYSLQVSSWKQRRLAESEVNRLINRGFNAFINKMYIEEFKDTWNRVRVGPFNTLGEAKAAQLKINNNN